MKTSTKSFKKAPAILAAFTLSAALLMSGSSFSMKASAASEPGAWQADFSTIEEAHEYATELNNELMGEGCVLMKNNNDVLPLAKGTAISVVGTRSYDIVTGGTGSGSGGGIKVDMPEAMNRAGFRVNGKMAPLYAGVNSKATIAADIWGSVTVTVETDPSILKPVEDSIKMYDTVIWTIARTGGEGADLFTHSLSTNKDPTKHLLELDDNELATLDYLTELKEQGIIKNVVVLMNVANVMEMGVLEESDTVDSILWIGQPGPEGLEGVGRVLNGEYTPSGRTVDIWTADHTLDPTWQNFSDYSQFSYDEETGTYTQDNVRGINDMVNAEGEVVSGTAVVEYEEGRIVGNDSLFTDTPGWYAPGLNIHRSPMGGRNFEYYSEDPFLSGMMTASIMKGLNQGGVFVNLKHFAMNEQETHRSVNGLLTWSTEQAMREIYLKGFEIAIKVAQQDYTPQADGERVEGGSVKAMGVMSSFNRIGTRWVGGDYRLLTTILRDEWGFEGVVICDFNTCTHMIVKDMVYAGGDLNLEMAGFRVWKDIDADSAADVSVIRQASKNILYPIVNSNAYRGDFIMHMPVWQVVMIVIDCVLVAGLAVWGFFAVKNALKKQNNA